MLMISPVSVWIALDERSWTMKPMEVVDISGVGSYLSQIQLSLSLKEKLAEKSFCLWNFYLLVLGNFYRHVG